MIRYNNILEAIGRTPLAKLNRVVGQCEAPVDAKCDYLNPGGSVKDRIGIAMIEDAEREGLLKPGGTIVEDTSGNTGLGLALAAAVRGYRAVVTITDKRSKEDVGALKALGTEVVTCPVTVTPEDPRSLCSVAEKLTREIRNAYHPNQYQTPVNPEIHYRTTGPEIREDGEGRVTHFVCGMGTGGTTTGVARFLKEKIPDVRVVGVDSIGSLLYEFFHRRTVSKSELYQVDGIGEDVFPATLDFSVIEDVRHVSDKESFLWAQPLARMEGILAGRSAGSALATTRQVLPSLSEMDFLVVLIPDTGNRYLSKLYDDEWMEDTHCLVSYPCARKGSSQDLRCDFTGMGGEGPGLSRTLTSSASSLAT